MQGSNPHNSGIVLAFNQGIIFGFIAAALLGRGRNQSIPHPDNFAFHFQYPVVFQLQNQLTISQLDIPGYLLYIIFH